MLEACDARVVAREPRLRGLGVLLDTGLLAGVLARAFPARRVESLRACYLRYKPGTSCLVAYTATVDGQPARLYARCHGDDDPVKLANAVQRLDVAGALGAGVAADAESGVAIFAYPNDYEIRSLRKLYEGERTPPRMRRILPAHPHLHRAEPELLRYKPERRFVARLEGEGGVPVALRLYRPDDFERFRRNSWAFRDGDGLRVARVVGDSERYSALAHEWLEGPTLAQVIGRGGGASDALARTATALASLHGQRPALDTMYSAADFVRSMRGASGAVRAAEASLGERAMALAGVIASMLEGRRWRSRAVHGDFTADQVIVGDGAIGVLDLDRAGYGDPGMDVGTLRAALIARAIRGDIDMGEAVASGEEFAAAYASATGGVWENGLRTFTAGALLMMAPEPFRERRSGWDRAIESMLDATERLLQGVAIDA